MNDCGGDRDQAYLFDRDLSCLAMWLSNIILININKISLGHDIIDQLYSRIIESSKIISDRKLKKKGIFVIRDFNDENDSEDTIKEDILKRIESLGGEDTDSIFKNKLKLIAKK